MRHPGSTSGDTLLGPQVETVGDKYMAVSGLPEPCTSHARCMARLALDMMDLSSEVKVDGTPVVRPSSHSWHWSSERVLV